MKSYHKKRSNTIAINVRSPFPTAYYFFLKDQHKYFSVFQFLFQQKVHELQYAVYTRNSYGVFATWLRVICCLSPQHSVYENKYHIFLFNILKPDVSRYMT